MSMNTETLGKFFLKKEQNVNPLKHPDETFELFSIPAYDKQQAEILNGVGIGSSKKLLYPNDVILSRIVPHIRRCWIVPSSTEHRQIGSGEWIIFRSDSVYPPYLRYYLLSDTFNNKFMSTVKGVGGSLLRADPKQVAKFNIPLPLLPTQIKIAAILDAADELRQKDKELIAKYDELAKSLFLDMFGDPYLNPHNWEIDQLQNLVKKNKIVTYGIVQAGPNVLNGIQYIKTSDIVNNVIKTTGLSKTSYEIAKKYERSKVSIGDLIMSIRATVGTLAFLPKELDGANLTQGTARISPGKRVNRYFLYYCILSKGVQSWIGRQIKGATFKEITLKRLREMPLIVPPIELQNDFAENIQLIEDQKQQAENSQLKSEELFQSLLQRAFKGELVS